MSVSDEPYVFDGVVFSSQAEMNKFIGQLKSDYEMQEAEDFHECYDMYCMICRHCRGTILFENLTMHAWFDFVMSLNRPHTIDIEDYLESDDELSS